MCPRADIIKPSIARWEDLCLMFATFFASHELATYRGLRPPDGSVRRGAHEPNSAPDQGGSASGSPDLIVFLCHA